jgi:hypothetical protein
VLQYGKYTKKLILYIILQGNYTPIHKVLSQLPCAGCLMAHCFSNQIISLLNTLLVLAQLNNHHDHLTSPMKPFPVELREVL